MKLAHLADLHLGFRQYDRQTPRGGNQREADVAEAFRRAVDDLLVQRPDLIVFAGDIFHSVRPTNPAILFLFQQLHRLRTGLPDAPIVMIAGEHDTPRSVETGTILRLYEALGVEVVVDRASYLTFAKLDCSVFAAPHQAVVQPERPALRPQRGTTCNVLLLHGQLPGLGEQRGTAEYGGALINQHDLAPARRHFELPAIDGHGLSARELDQHIAAAVGAAKPPIDDQVVRLLVWNVARATARDLDHAAIRQYKARALNFHLDLRRPEEHRVIGVGAPGRRHTLPDTLREFLGRRPLDADLDRDEFVRLGVEYLERVGREGEEPG